MRTIAVRDTEGMTQPCMCTRAVIAQCVNLLQHNHFDVHDEEIVDLIMRFKVSWGVGGMIKFKGLMQIAIGEIGHDSTFENQNENVDVVCRHVIHSKYGPWLPLIY